MKQAKKDAELEIIRLLKAAGAGGAGGAGGNGYVTGTRLGNALKVSRTAVWKQIEALRKAGYVIEAGRSKGYRLERGAKAPFNGVEIRSALDTGLIGTRVVFHPELESTNTTAFELARANEPEGTAVVAERQTRGKGRVGRTWESPSGVNLYTSIILRPRISPRDAHKLTFLLAVATAEAVSSFIDARATVKWPNDILAGSRKIAGILLEMDSETELVHFVIAGIGVNVNMDVATAPDDLKRTATSIKDIIAEETDRAEVARVLYSSIEKWYKVVMDRGFDPVMEAWKGYFASEGKPISVSCFERIISGTCMGIDSDGALLVRVASGAVERVVSGDVVPTG